MQIPNPESAHSDTQVMYLDAESQEIEISAHSQDDRLNVNLGAPVLQIANDSDMSESLASTEEELSYSD